MRVDVTTGLLVGVKQVLSPHFDARPAGVEPDLVILHGISLPPGEFGGPWIARLFTGSLPPDVHPFFATRGECASPRTCSSAAMASRCSSSPSMSARGTRADPHGRDARPATTTRSASNAKARTSLPYEDAQYETLRALLPVLSGAYRGITGDRVVGHSDVAPGRKTDPGAAFDWSQVAEDLGD